LERETFRGIGIPVAGAISQFSKPTLVGIGALKNVKDFIYAMPPKKLDLGMLPTECHNKVPCKHCLSYKSLKGKGNLPFDLAVKIADEIQEYGFELKGVSLSGGEPLAYRSQGHDVIDLINLFPEDTPILIATEGASCAKYEKIIRKMEPLKCSVFWRFSYHRFTERDLIKNLEKTLGVLKEMGWPMAVERGNTGFFTKEIQVSAENSIELAKAICRLEEELFDGAYKRRVSKKELMLVNKGDVIPLKYSTITWRGCARKNFRPDEMEPHYGMMEVCPLKVRNFLGVDNGGRYRVCEPSDNPDFPYLGDARNTTVIEALERRYEIAGALRKMFGKKIDLKPFANQPCAYCEDNLQKFLER